MNTDEFKKKFEENVQYLSRNIPPDDIYVFCEQTFMAALYFLHRWNEHLDIEQECKDNPVSRKWVVNILSFYKIRDMGMDVNLDLDLESMDEDNT